MKTTAEPRKKQLLVRVDQEMYTRLVEMAGRERRSISSMVDVLLHASLQDRKEPRPQAGTADERRAHG